MHIVYYTQERDKNFEDKFLHNRWTFFNRRVLLVHNFWFPATFITDKFWSDPPLRRSHLGDVFSILFHWSIDQAILLVTLFHRSLDRAILLVTLLRRLRLPKIDFGTFQLGIAQLVPRVSGSPSHLPAPKIPKKKKFWKKFRTLPPPSPPPYWLEIDGSDRKKFPDLTRSHSSSSGGPRNLTVTLNFVPGAGPPTRPAQCTKGQPIRTDLTAPLLTLANYLHFYLIRLLPHSSAPLPSLSLSLTRLVCPGVKPFSDPNPLLFEPGS